MHFKDTANEQNSILINGPLIKINTFPSQDPKWYFSSPH